MAPKEFYYYWEWQLDASPEQFWPYFADTNRFNYDRGNASLEFSAEESLRLENAHRRLGMTIRGIRQTWNEEPFEWIRPYRHSVNRHFLDGPIDELRLVAELKAREGGGSTAIYHVWATARNFLGRLLIPYLLGKFSYERFDRAFRMYDELAVSDNPAVKFTMPGPVTFPEGGRERLDALRMSLLKEGINPTYVSQLTNLVDTADDMTIARMRPYALADVWRLDRRKLLEFFLIATRAGLLEFRWELLCPQCRNTRFTAMHMSQLISQVHCNTCNISFGVNFDRSVEMSFRPSPAIRVSRDDQFCVGGPEVTPHIVVQQLLPPRETRSVTLPLEEGRYRFRVLEKAGARFLQAQADGTSEASLVVDNDDWPDDELLISTRPILHLVNRTDEEQLLIVDRMAWSDQTVTAADVASMQTFRDLFADEVLRPGEEIAVGTVTLLCTDLRGSTRLYRHIGDARALGAVMHHFDVLREEISSEGGAIVKTMGDAVMAVFTRPAPALRAILRAQQRLAQPEDGQKPMLIKAGIHSGPCLAVNLNDRLDYFGATTNLAFRMQDYSTGAEVILSHAVYKDPEISAMLESDPGELIIQTVETPLKGYEDTTLLLYLVAPKEGLIKPLTMI